MASIDAQSGRAAAVARRLALSAGKAALPPATERVRDGQRSASQPQGTAVAVRPATPAAVYVPPATPRPAAVSSTVFHGLTGKDASVERRRLLSAGKSAVGQTPQPQAVAVPEGATSRDISRARRLTLSQTSLSGTDAPVTSAPPPVTIEASSSTGAQRVTSSRIGRGDTVTGDRRGTGQPVSGTQNIGANAGGSWRVAGPKVGLAKTSGGLTVSGTMVRSAVAVTGDEAGSSAVTGRVDQSPADDLTARGDRGSLASSQLQRQNNPLAASALGGPSAQGSAGGSRARQRERVAESTEGGAAITGVASGRGLYVTGDPTGPTRRVTGNHYMSAIRQRGAAPETAAAPQAPARSGAVAESLGGQRVTGLDVEHNRRVTGDLPGMCANLTGSQYHGPASTQAACRTGKDTATSRRMAARATRAVTGTIPLHAEGVTGTGRGAGRDVTGTRYFNTQDAPPPVAPGQAVAQLDNSFSIRSPQRAAQLAATTDVAATDRITGSFAAGGSKLTGNMEFQSRRRAAEAAREPASTRISGEGSSVGTAITGNAWSNKGRVTGADGASAAARNPTERGESAKPFAGATTFKARAKTGECSQLVTGSFSKSGARVTLSGGAQT